MLFVLLSNSRLEMGTHMVATYLFLRGNCLVFKLFSKKNEKTLVKVTVHLKFSTKLILS